MYSLFCKIYQKNGKKQCQIRLIFRQPLTLFLLSSYFSDKISLSLGSPKLI